MISQSTQRTSERSVAPTACAADLFSFNGNTLQEISKELSLEIKCDGLCVRSQRQQDETVAV